MFGFKELRNWQVSLGIATTLFKSHFDLSPEDACLRLNNDQDVDLSAFNTTILNTTYFNNISRVEKLGASEGLAQINAALCRVQFLVNTSSLSAITAEVWLPTNWNNRFLALGNGGLGGLIDYDNLDYGTSLGFATVASNNGHDGNTGVFFANNSEVLADFTSRAIHVETLVGKRILDEYYSRPAKHSYYLGCSTGGRQGIYSALYHPGDFDGILAGAPATNFISLLGWSALVSKALGAPYGEKSERHISPTLLEHISAEILRQCHFTLRAKGGFISEPESCAFRPEELICSGKTDAGRCLSGAQVQALRFVFSPVYGLNGEYIFPRLDPGAEESNMLFSGEIFKYSDDWMKYVVFNDPNYDYRDIDLKAIAKAQAQDPGNISTFNGDLSAFHARGGKLISYHGLSDPVIPAGNSRDFYDLVSRTLNATSSTLDEFYRLFLVPGMGHCSGGRGSFRFGQHSRATPPIEYKGEDAASKVSEDLGVGKKNLPVEESVNNILLDLVNWVEEGRAPDFIRGATEDGKSKQVHCRYPKKVSGDNCLDGPQAKQ